MIEKTEEHEWVSKDDDENKIFRVTARNGEVICYIDGLDSLEDYKEFHQALGEAIAIAEAQE